MKTKLLKLSSLAFASAAIGLVLAGCGGGTKYTETGQVRYSRSTGEYIDDKAIEGKVKTALLREDSVKGMDVSVEVYQGAVQLSGFVDTEEQKNIAEETARSITGVRSVKNNLALKPGAREGEEGLQPAGKETATRSTQTSLDFKPQKASTLIGMKVENQGNEKLGDINDLLIDANSGKIKFAVISSGGVLGIGDTTRLVPAAALKFDPADNNVVLNITQDRWKQSPEFQERELSSYNDEGRTREIYTYYNIDLPGDAQATVRTESEEGEELSPTGKAANEIGRSTGLFRASHLIGKNILNQQQEKVGHVNDLFVDLDAKSSALAIVETDGYLQDRDGQFLIPVRAFGTPSENQRHVILNIDRTHFQQAREFQGNWPAQGDRLEVYRYNKGDFDNKPESRRNVTPGDQSENRQDVQITQKIRRELVQNNQLSSSAKNVNVITRDGKVIIKGAVRNQTEKETVVDIAQRIAGNGNVESDLQVSSR